VVAARTAETPEYDPRYDRAQTVEGAKARYLSDDLPDYDLDAFEADVERLLEQGDHPDAEKPPLAMFEGQEVIR
jgi:hypothetical protein